ncbi:MAG: maleylpyruvate isomerase family mycothiol-dependent enzyme [Actinomycetia bacterium]|nr:maleylpyruvate isomerase family mycothiol-dependent enzyme [Actinomycetes bacterium]
MIPVASPFDYAALFEVERGRLVELLQGLSAGDWERPSPCPGWSVLGLAVHLLGGDLSFISWHRDGHYGTPPPAGLDEVEFINWIDELQIEWVHSARRLSPPVVVALLHWTATQIVETIAAQDPSAAAASVSWASSTPVPVWLDQARELSERWIHRQQLLQAVGEPSDLRSDLAVPVLDGLRWAYPFRLGRVVRSPGAAVRVSVLGREFGADWMLRSTGDGWMFSNEVMSERMAEMSMSSEQAWRQLTNNADPVRHGQPAVIGDPEIVSVLLETRAIIGVPKTS